MSERFKKEFLAEGSECTWKDYPLATDVLDWVRLQEQTHHHQLQKARQDWLRSEIEKLDGIRKPDVGEEDFDGWNDCLTSIITRYKEELLELEKGV